ncbi:MAG: pyrrolo-quinoline quinone, partial [Pirellulaceae bacterium]|nr:pyrrolo-quinoline quinone [Pirellulaceae bacterium]
MKHFIGLLVVLFISATASAENWPSWRGPDQNGVGPKGPFPTTWSADSNIAWKITLPGSGSSTPVVWDENIVLTTTENGANITLCLDRNGKEKWR